MLPRRWSLAFVAAALVGSPSMAALDEEGFIGVQLKVNTDAPGFLVMVVMDDGPAAKAGLKPNDILTKLDGNEVKELADFVKQIREHKPGDEIKLTIERSGKEMEIKLKVGKRPAAGQTKSQ